MNMVRRQFAAPAVQAPPEHRLTDEQLHIVDLTTKTTDNLMLNALAGCGKTSTIELLEKHDKVRPQLYLVFNAKNAKEATGRMLSTTTVRTFNSMGHRVWATTTGKNLSLDPKKSQAIFRSIIDETPKRDQSEIWDSYWPVIQGVAIAKALGYVPEGKFPNARRLTEKGALHATLDEPPDDLTSDLIDAVLTRSIVAAYAGAIDYNDQIYMPALFGGNFPRFPVVKVDEYQDLNPTNHAMLDRLVHGRIIGVGDPWQNIYGFRGAKSAGMAEAVTRFKMTPCDLSVSFRCPQAIVEAAHWRVPHFKWMKPGGHVETLAQLALSDISDSAVVICRNNAPLFRLALRLLSAGRSVSVQGSEIGPKLIAQMERIGAESATQKQFLGAIDEWLAERLAKESKSAQDLADCMRVFANSASTKSAAIAHAKHVFAQNGSIRMLTGHKSKGLEFPTVYHLDPWLLKEEEQDQNLRYVIGTRSMDTYYEIDSSRIV